MKKCEFYTIKNSGNGPEAVKVSGYTDGAYNYYKNEFGQWFAIVPEFGLSVAQENTRKATAAAARKKEIVEAVNKYRAADVDRRWYGRFLELVKIKEAAEAAA